MEVEFLVQTFNGESLNAESRKVELFNAEYLASNHLTQIRKQRIIYQRKSYIVESLNSESEKVKNLLNLQDYSVGMTLF